MAGVALGLVLGKPIGVTLFAWLAVRAGLAALPRGVIWGQIGASGAVAGIGFHRGALWRIARLR